MRAVRLAEVVVHFFDRVLVTAGERSSGAVRAPDEARPVGVQVLNLHFDPFVVNGCRATPSHELAESLAQCSGTYSLVHSLLSDCPA